jgi:hypothetical protein
MATVLPRGRNRHAGASVTGFDGTARPRITVTATSIGWVLAVSDAAADRPPTPAVDRDPADGGLGFYIVARLCAAYGWYARDGRKTVWGRIDSAVTHAAPYSAA